MKNVSILSLLSLMTLTDFSEAIKVNEQMKSHNTIQQKLKQKSAVKSRTGVKSHQQLLAEVMQREYPVSVTEASYLDAQILAGVDEDGTEAPAEIATATDASASNSTEGAANTTAAADGNKTAGDNSEGNKIDDDVVDQTRAWTNEHYGIKDVNDTDPVYGHKVFKDEMNKFLPYHTKKPVNQRWQYGWHLQELDVDHSADWDKNLNKGGDKATEGYYPIDEDDEEKTWARREQKYQNYGPWNYRWGTNFWKNGGYNGNPSQFGGYPTPYPYGYNSGYAFGEVGEPKRNPDGTLQEDPLVVSAAAESVAQTTAQDIQSIVQADAAQSQTDKYTRDESGTGAEGDVDADWY